MEIVGQNSTPPPPRIGQKIALAADQWLAVFTTPPSRVIGGGEKSAIAARCAWVALWCVDILIKLGPGIIITLAAILTVAISRSKIPQPAVAKKENTSAPSRQPNKLISANDRLAWCQLMGRLAGPKNAIFDPFPHEGVEQSKNSLNPLFLQAAGRYLSQRPPEAVIVPILWKGLYDDKTQAQTPSLLYHNKRSRKIIYWGAQHNGLQAQLERYKNFSEQLAGGPFFLELHFLSPHEDHYASSIAALCALGIEKSEAELEMLCGTEPKKATKTKNGAPRLTMIMDRHVQAELDSSQGYENALDTQDLINFAALHSAHHKISRAPTGDHPASSWENAPGALCGYLIGSGLENPIQGDPEEKAVMMIPLVEGGHTTLLIADNQSKTLHWFDPLSHPPKLRHLLSDMAKLLGAWQSKTDQPVTWSVDQSVLVPSQKHDNTCSFLCAAAYQKFLESKKNTQNSEPITMAAISQGLAKITPERQMEWFGKIQDWIAKETPKLHRKNK